MEKNLKTSGPFTPSPKRPLDVLRERNRLVCGALETNFLAKFLGRESVTHLVGLIVSAQLIDLMGVSHCFNDLCCFR